MRKLFVSVIRSKVVSKFLSVFVLLGLALSSFGSSPIQPALSASENGSWLQVEYRSNADQIVTVEYSNITRQADGSVVTNIVITNKRHNVYDLTFEQTGTVTKLTPSGRNFFTVSWFPLVGKSKLTISQVNFSPNSALKIKFSKWGYSAEDTGAIASLDLATAATLFTLGIHLPTKPADFVEGLKQGGLDLITAAQKAGFDLGVLVAKLLSGDYWGAFVSFCEGLVHATDGPQKLQQFIAGQFGLSVSQSAITEFVTVLGRATHIFQVVPLIWDLVVAPRYGEVVVSNISLAPIPTAPILVAPTNGSTTNSLHPSFGWTIPAGAAGYVFELSPSSDFSSVIIRQTIPSNFFSVPADLQPNSTFYWRVSAFNSAGSSTPSSIWSFRTPASNSPPTPDFPHDNATFVRDVTLPDGIVVSPGQALVKTWRLKNTGSTTWGNGYQLVFVNGEQMGAPGAVNVPSTAPNATTDISINLTAPTSGGNHTGYWRLRNPQGTYFGPTIWVSLNVLTPSPGSGRITLFDVSPASPSAATLVHVVGRVRWFPEFRSMRFVLGNEVQEMTNFRQVGDQLEISADWNTATLARGNYALALEVATQGDLGWVTPERQVKTYTLSGTPAPMNRAPNRPSLTSPYDWYVYYSGNTATLCAQADGDPDGDAIAGYYFDIFDSAQLWNSGWTGSNCVTTSALGPYSYQWRVKVRDGSGAESGWSDSRHFTLVNPSLSISELYFQPLDANSEQVKIRTCTTGQAGIGITMRVSVNDANDGSGNGNWHIIKEQGSPCFNDIDAPIWNTLEYGDGPHRVRSEAHGLQTGWNGAAVREETYTLPHRRPPAPQTVSPSTPNDNGTWWNTPTITFRWKLALRATSYRLRVTTSADVWNDPAPVLDVALGSTATVYTYTFGQDYDRLYWSVRASNGSGAGDSGAAWFGIDRAKPTCSIQPLPAVVYDNVFQVTWAGTDNASGVRSYEIRYLDFEADNHAIWEQPLASTIYDLFTGWPGHTYRFFCRATDKAGNTSDMPANYERSVRVDPSARPPTPWWNGAYTQKRNLTILNNMPGMTLPAGYPVRVRFDSTTNPTAAEIYNASQSSPKCNDLRVVYIDTTELDRVMEKCSNVEVEFWFRSQVSITGGESNNTAHQLYYGNASPGALLANAVQVFYPGMDANTVGLWYLEGDANDASSYSHSGQWLGGASWSAGKFGQGISLPGNVQTQGGIRVPGTEALRVWSFTVEAFVKRARNDGYCGGHFASQGESGSERERWFAEIDFDKLHLQIWNRGDRRGTNGSYPIDAEWHHVAVAFDNNTLEYRFYRDGNLISSGYMDTWEFKLGNANFYIGNLFPYIDGQMNTFCGSIDGVRLSNVARSTFGAYATFGSITNEPTTGAGAPIAPPITGAADLAVLNLDTYPNLTGGVLVQAVIQNQGNLDTQNGFNTDVYLNHVPLGSGDYAGSIQFWVNDPIAAGATVTLTTVITDLSRPSGANLQSVGSVSESSGTLYAQVDSTGAVSETNNLNNIYSAGTEICVASPDAYESDDSAGAAKPISVGQTQTHNFSGPGDRDWVTFTAQGGMTYTLRTFNLGVSADTYLYLYDTNGTTLLASNDDYDGSLASWLDWTAPATGTYYVAVQHWNPNVGGCGTAYDLAVTRALTIKMFLSIVFKNH